MPVTLARDKREKISLPIPGGYNLAAMCKAYRWVKDPPLEWRRDSLICVHDLSTVVCQTAASVNGKRLEVEVEASRPLDPEERNLLILQLRRIYSLQWDLRPFHKLLNGEKELSWISKNKLGWFLRSASLFEDVVKMLLSVNCAPDQERELVRNLVSQLGRPLSSRPSRRAFPTPQTIVKAGVTVLRDWVKAGYRSQAVVEAAHRFLKGEFQETDLAQLRSLELRKRLLGLRGLDRSYLRQLLLYLGRFEELWPDVLSLSSGGRRVRTLPAGAQAIQETYRKWGEWQGLVAWLDLNQELFAARN